MIAAEVSRSRLVHQPEDGRAREPRRLGLALAVLIVGFGVAGIWANLLGVERLKAPIAGWPGLFLLSSIELLLIGATFLALLRGNRGVGFPLAALSSAVALGGMFGTLGAYPVPMGGMALSSAILFSALSFAMLVATASRSPRDEERALGVGGFIVIALVCSMFGATAMGVLDPAVDANVAGSSLQALLGALAIGAYWLGILWVSGRVTIESADWLPAGVGFASLLTVLVLWRALTVRESLQLQTLTLQAGEGQQRALEASVGTLSRSLSHAAERWAVNGPAEQGVLDLDELRRDLSGLKSVAFMPLPGSETVKHTTSGSAALDSVWAARATTVVASDSVTYWPLDTAVQRIAVVAPSCANRVCTGAIVGLVETSALFGGMVSDTTHGFFHSVGTVKSPSDSARLQNNEDNGPIEFLPLRIGDLRLQLLTWPTNSTLSRVRSKLPAVMLVMGTLLSGLLLLTTLLGQGARRVARSRERARLASVLERSTDGIWEWDLTSGTAEHSTGIWRSLGYEKSADSGKRDAWMALVHPDDAEGFTRAMQRHIDGDADAFEYEYRVRSQNGSWHTMVDRARVVEWTPSGQPLRLLGVRADVTEARNVQSARLLNERRFRAIFDSGFQYQLLLDLEGQVLEVNRVALEACHTSLPEVVGKPVWQTLWWADSAEARAPLQEAFAAARDGTASRYETEVHADGGSRSTLEVALKPFLDRAGQTNQLLLEARDITVRRRSEAALQEVDTLTTMGRVAARVAHEINNPLAGIQNSFLLIKGAIPLTHPHYAYVGAIEREIDRIAAVTRQLYETYRPEQDPGGGTSVRSLVADAVSFLAQVNRGTVVRVETDFSNVPSVINLPSAMLRQIVYNLAQNAIEASPAGQVVRIAASITGKRFHLTVRDHGAGVPPELRDRIFDPFFSTKDRGVRTGGMGLGLALVRRTVTAAGGSISVQDAPDGGSIFTVTLPVPSGAQGEEG